MAEPEGTTGLDESLEGSDALEGAEEREEYDDDDDDDDDDGDEQVAEEVAEPPRRRLVSELLEGEGVLEEGARSDLQVVAPPLHGEVGDTGQPIYQLDLSSGEPEGTLLEPESSAIPPEPDYAAEPMVGAAPGSDAEAGTADTQAVLKQMIADRDRQVMKAERDGINAYELAVGIDHFVATLIETVRRSDS
ncbi:MAG: hypothetical protein IH849_15250 [Acidobacteria bacterium]|nr:hypothetical protein [Acidobacteriota bacterium]